MAIVIRYLKKIIYPAPAAFIFFMLFFSISFAATSDESIYSEMLSLAKKGEAAQLFESLNGQLDAFFNIDPGRTEFAGNLRKIENKGGSGGSRFLYMIRSVKGELYVLLQPDSKEGPGASYMSAYQEMDSMLTAKMHYRILTAAMKTGERVYRFAVLEKEPEISLVDRIFRVAVVVVLFAVMLGMGMTLTPKDFFVVLKKPLGIFAGLFCIFGIMPFIAYLLGHFLGYDKTEPFVYVGLILVTATPGGAASNLMTHLGKGDVALSISLTAVATMLSLVVTPFILFLYCSNLPQVEMPVKMVVLPILILVIVPLITGMAFKAKWEQTAEKLIPVFNMTGILAIFVCFTGGILSNLEMFSSALGKFGITGCLVVLLLVVTGMGIGGLAAGLPDITNYQARAISMETGIRNVVLGMTIALLIQDRIGDYNSYMFAVSGCFAILMYLATPFAISFHRRFLPVHEKR